MLWKDEKLLSHRLVTKRVASKSFSFVYQLNLWDGDDEDIRRSYCTFIGSFYEHLTRAIFGGTLLDFKGTGVRPDIRNDGCYYESKTACWRYSWKIKRDQLFYLYDEFGKVNYILFKSKIVKPMTEFKGLTQEQIVEILADNVAFAVVLPINIMRVIIASTSGWFPHYEGRGWTPWIQISSEWAKWLVIDPRRELKGIGIKTGEYRFYKRVTPVMQVNGIDIKPFYLSIVRKREVVPF